LPTEAVEESEIHRYQLIARDRHIDIDWVTIEPLEIKPHTARDGEALSQQIDQSKGLFVLYIIAVASLCFGVSMLVLYRREKQMQIDEEASLLDQSEIIATAENMVAPPPGFDNVPPPATITVPTGFENMPPPNTVVPPFSTEQPAPTEPHIHLDFSDNVFSQVLRTFGIHNSTSFLTFAGQYDEDGNGYLRKSELERAATEYVAGGHNDMTATTTGYSDEQLLAGGWTQEQIDTARDNGQI